MSYLSIKSKHIIEQNSANTLTLAMTSVPPILTLAEPFAYHKAKTRIKIILEQMNTEKT